MSIDLTAAVDEAARLIARRWNMSSRNRDVRDDASALIAAAAPLIEAALREQIAGEIEASKSEGKPYGGFRADDIEFGKNVGKDEAARIARGEAQP